MGSCGPGTKWLAYRHMCMTELRNALTAVFQLPCTNSPTYMPSQNYASIGLVVRFSSVQNRTFPTRLLLRFISRYQSRVATVQWSHYNAAITTRIRPTLLAVIADPCVMWYNLDGIQRSVIGGLASYVQTIRSRQPQGHRLLTIEPCSS